MRNLIVINLLFLLSHLTAQEPKVKLVEVLNPFLLSKEYKDLRGELKKTYRDLALRDTFKIEFTFDSLWRLQDFVTNESSNFSNIKANIAQKDWIFENYRTLSAEMKDKYELVPLRKCKIKLFKKRNSIRLVSNIQKVNINMYDARNLFFLKGIILKSEKPIKPLNSWFLNNYIKDSLKLNIENANAYMHIDKIRKFKFTVPERLFKFNSKVFIRTKEIGIVELNKKHNYIFLPKGTKIDFLAVHCNTGNVIIESLKVSEDLIINDKYNASNYFKLAEMISKW